LRSIVYAILLIGNTIAADSSNIDISANFISPFVTGLTNAIILVTNNILKILELIRVAIVISLSFFRRAIIENINSGSELIAANMVSVTKVLLMPVISTKNDV